MEKDGLDIQSVKLHFDNIVHDLKINCLVDMMKTQLGIQCSRIIRLLLERQALEEQQIGELALIPQKEARKCIFELMQRGLLNWEEAPRKNDFNAKQTFHIWTVDIANLLDYYVQLGYKSILNMKARCRRMEGANKDLNRFRAYESKEYAEATRRNIPGIWRYRKFKAALLTLELTTEQLARTLFLLDVL